MRRRQGKLISDLPQATGRPQREPIPYICDFSRGGLNTRLHALVSKPCSEAINMLYLASGVLCVGSSENQLEEFGNFSKGCDFMRKYSESITVY